MQPISETQAPAYDAPQGARPAAGMAEAEASYLDLAELRTQVGDYLSQKQAEVEEQKEGRRYYHGVQWTREQMDAIRARGQPVTTKNEFARKVNAVVGLIERLKQDPKAYPNSPKHADGADVATETLRYAMNAQQWDAVQSRVARNAAIDGVYGVELDLIQGDKGDPEVGLGLVQPDTFFYDPRSVEDDFSDALYMGTSKWVDRNVLKSMFPQHAGEIDGLIMAGSDMTIDSDRDIVWVNSNRRMLRAVDHWYMHEGKWCWCFHVGSLKLDEGQSPWTDEKGKSSPKFIMSSGSVDHEGDRYGFLRNLKTPADEVNQRTSRLLHISNSRRLILKKSAVKDVETTRREWARADGVVEINENAEYGRDIMRDDTQQDFQGQLLLLQEAKGDFDRFGPNAAQLGEQGSAGKSGRAIALLQQAGLSELGPFLIAFRSWKHRVYRAMWNAIQQFWLAERWIRVTDSEGLAQFIQLNGLTIDEYGRPAIVNAVGSLDVDIVLDESGDQVTTMMEALETLQSALAAGMPIPPDILIDLLPIRQDIKKRLRERMEQANKPDPAAEKAKQIALEQEEAKTGKVRADTFKATADAVTTIADSSLGMGQVAGMMPEQGGGAPQGGAGDIPPEAMQQMLGAARNGQPLEVDPRGAGMAPNQLAGMLEAAGNAQPGAGMPPGQEGVPGIDLDMLRQAMPANMRPQPSAPF